MGLVSGTVKNLFGGVSQAPQERRDASEFTEELNAFPIYGTKLGRRPPSLHIAKLATRDLTGAFEHTLGNYTLLVLRGAVRVFETITGVEQLVETQSGTGAYLGALGTLKATTSGDTAFLLNTGVATQKGGGTFSPSAASTRPAAIIVIRTGDYSTTYTLTLNSVSVSTTTPNNTAPTDKPNISTSVIATALAAAIAADPSLTTLFTVETFGSTLYIYALANADFTVTSTDSLGDKGMSVIKGQVQQFSDLPELTKGGVILEVVGDGSTAFDNYFVQYVAGLTAGEKGVWEEVPAPGSTLNFDPVTMPVRVVKNGDYITAEMGTLPPPAAVTAGATALKKVVTVSDVSVYPMGTVYYLTLKHGLSVFDVLLSYTVTGETETATQVAAGLAAVVDAHADYIATSTLNVINIEKTTAGSPLIVHPSLQFNTATKFWSAGVTMVSAEHVGRKIINLTTGAEGTITANSVNVVTVGSLSGGSSSVFSPEDKIVIRRADGVTVFLVQKCPWADREAGDTLTVPHPSFTGKTLSDVFVHQGRLGVLSGDKIVMSQAGDLYNFFRTTATQVLSSDPIDISGAVSGISSLDWAVNWKEALYLFANGLTQYKLDSGQSAMTVESVRLTQVSEYRYSALVRPIVAGQRLFFVALKSGLPHIMDYHTKGYERTHEALDLGLHVPTYFQGSPLSLTADDAQGLLLFHTDVDAGRTLYCFKYHVENDARVQGAWSTWTFSSGRILATSFSNGVVSLIQAYYDGTCLNEIILDPERLLVYEGFILYNAAEDFDADIDFDGGPNATTNTAIAAHLDRYVDTAIGNMTAVFDGVNTVWTLPYATSPLGIQGDVGITAANPGVLLPITQLSPVSFSAPGDYTADTVRAGVRYDTAHTLSTIFLRDKATGAADTRGRLQLRWLRVQYADVTDLDIVVSSAGREDRVYTTTFTYPQSGTALIPVLLRNTDCTIAIHADGSGADALVSYEWEGTYHARAARL